MQLELLYFINLLLILDDEIVSLDYVIICEFACKLVVYRENVTLETYI